MIHRGSATTGSPTLFCSVTRPKTHTRMPTPTPTLPSNCGSGDLPRWGRSSYDGSIRVFWVEGGTTMTRTRRFHPHPSTSTTLSDQLKHWMIHQAMKAQRKRYNTEVTAK
jgi:hypothetical protein